MSSLEDSLRSVARQNQTVASELVDLQAANESLLNERNKKKKALQEKREERLDSQVCVVSVIFVCRNVHGCSFANNVLSYRAQEINSSLACQNSLWRMRTAPSACAVAKVLSLKWSLKSIKLRGRRCYASSPLQAIMFLSTCLVHTFRCSRPLG